MFIIAHGIAHIRTVRGHITPAINATFLWAVLSVAAVLLLECSPESDPVSATPPASLEQLYQQTILDAVVADSNEICTTLVAITPSDTRHSWLGTGDSARVLVATWTKYISSYPTGDTVDLVWGETWVTVPFEFRQWCSTNNPHPDSTLRIEQLLGLPARKGNTHFVELWVRPSDLFRPAPDCEIADRRAGLCLPSDADSAYKNWYEQNILYSYFPPRFPWTRLGYTYDWGNPTSEVGLSEFVIRKNAPAIVKAAYTTAEYIGR